MRFHDSSRLHLKHHDHLQKKTSRHKALALLGSLIVAGGAALLSIGPQKLSKANDELYRFSGRQAMAEREHQQPGTAGPSTPQEQMRQEILAPPGQSATGPGFGINQQPPAGTVVPNPGGGPKLGVGPVGPGGTSRAAVNPNEGPNRYRDRPPSWEVLNETTAGINKPYPGQSNTSVASGANIFGTTPVPFAIPIGTPPPAVSQGPTQAAGQAGTQAAGQAAHSPSGNK